MKIHITILCLAAMLLATPARGHHSFAQFDRDTQLLISGQVVRWAFNNPHVWLYVNVANEDGSKTMWSFEGSGPINLLRKGINGNAFKPGDLITLMHCPLRDGRAGGHVGWVRVADGSFLDVSDGGCSGDAETIEKWKGWLTRGVTSSAEVAAD
jgi:hypothetical protein